MTLQVLIKSPSQHVEDFKVDCDVTWTVGQVKDQITALYPSKPRKEHQKLIYGGKLLSDHLLLKEVLNKNQEAHTMHLVCPLPPVPADFKMFDTHNELRQRHGFAQEPFQSPPLNPLYSDMNQPLLNTQGLPSVPGMASYGAGAPLNVTYPPVDVAYQYMAVQQMYSQFMNQYLSQANGGVPPGNMYGYNPVQAPSTYQNSAIPTQLSNERRAPNVPEQRPPPVREEGERDYIDWLYLMSRALMLFAILYYYSSLTRILTVLFLGFFISMYVRVTRQYQRQVDEFHEQRQRPNVVEGANRDNADIQASGTDAASDESTSEANSNPSEDDSTIQQEAQPYVSMLSVILTFFSSFLTSLIPSEPAPININ